MSYFRPIIPEFSEISTGHVELISILLAESWLRKNLGHLDNTNMI